VSRGRPITASPANRSQLPRWQFGVFSYMADRFSRFLYATSLFCPV